MLADLMYTDCNKRLVSSTSYNRHNILVLVCSKYITAKPHKTKQSSTAVHHVENFCSVFRTKGPNAFTGHHHENIYEMHAQELSILTAQTDFVIKFLKYHLNGQEITRPNHTLLPSGINQEKNFTDEKLCELTSLKLCSTTSRIIGSTLKLARNCIQNYFQGLRKVSYLVSMYLIMHSNQKS